MEVLTEQEIIDELFQMDLEESTNLFEASSKTNKTVLCLKNIYESFLAVEKSFHFYLGELEPLFESDGKENNSKELAKTVRKAISNLSRNIGKLDQALSEDPPKVFKDVDVANSYLEKVETSHERLIEEINSTENKTRELNQLSDLYEKSYYSMKVKVQTFNQKSSVQKLKELS